MLYKIPDLPLEGFWDSNRLNGNAAVGVSESYKGILHSASKFTRFISCLCVFCCSMHSGHCASQLLQDNIGTGTGGEHIAHQFSSVYQYVNLPRTRIYFIHILNSSSSVYTHIDLSELFFNRKIIMLKGQQAFNDISLKKQLTTIINSLKTLN